MYTITYNGEVLYEPRFSHLYPVSDPKLTAGVNTAGSLSLKLYPQHPNYSAPQQLAGTIEAADGSEVLFRGRVLNAKLALNGVKELTCEGGLAFLNDSLIPPFVFPDDFLEDPDYQAAAASGNVIEFLLGWIIDTHNAQVGADRQFMLGDVTVTDPNNYITRSSEDYLSAWDAVRDKLFESSLGGHMYARYEAGGTYIDYVAEYDLTNVQEIALAVNLADLTEERSGESTYTVMLPLGAKDDSTGERLDISDLPEGALEPGGDIIKSGKTLYSTANTALYGRITAPVSETTWDDVTTLTALKNKAAAWLSSIGVKLKQSITLSAADLHFADATIQAFRPYQNVLLKLKDGTAAYELNGITYDLAQPSKTLISLGREALTSSGLSAQKAHADERTRQIIVNNIAGNTSAITELRQTVSAQATQILQDAQQIILSALESYVQTSDYNTYKQEIETQFSLVAGQIELNFRTLTDSITETDTELQRQYEERLRYIRFDNGDIILGEEGNEITLKITNDRISFRQNDAEIAYFSNNKLYVTAAQFTDRLQLGDFSFILQENGDLIFN